MQDEPTPPELATDLERVQQELRALTKTRLKRGFTVQEQRRYDELCGQERRLLDERSGPGS